MKSSRRPSKNTSPLPPGEGQGEGKSVPPLPQAGEGRGEGASESERKPLAIREGPIAPYIATPPQARHPRESGNPDSSPRSLLNVPLRELLTVLESGSRPKGGVKGIKAGVPSLGGEHLNSNGGFRFDRIRYVPHEFAAAMRRGKIQAGDILVVKDGATTGKVSLVRESFPYTDAVVNEHVFMCRCNGSVDPAYVFWYLYSAQGQEQILGDFRGAAQGGISQRFADLVMIPIRPIEDQRSIVTKLETQLTRLDASVAALKRVQANLKRYRASVLKAACEGRLVPTEAELARDEGRDYVSGLYLSVELANARRRVWRGGKYEEAVAPENYDRDLPEGWALVSLHALVSEPLRNGHSAKTTGGADGLRAFTLSAVTDGDFSVRNTKLTVASPVKVSNLWAMPGDIYVERSNTPELVGLARLYKGPKRFAFIPDLLIRVRPLSEIPGRFIELCLQAKSSRDYFRSRAQGIAGTMPKIDQATVQSTPIPLPPLAEQHRIVAEVERRLSVIEELEATVRANFKRAERLRQSILAVAFAG